MQVMYYKKELITSCIDQVITRRKLEMKATSLTTRKTLGIDINMDLMNRLLISKNFVVNLRISHKVK